ncbi:hypothetical protein DASC09_019190 [Saccharomycopsis crataegensis]|uniref:Uncharacterized protein n=1 Tax=Saccharomycopsis crataegensis TaxID=43959 RepID=A0AAV5QIZ4_9ASCO|nr:hypothetical protein DASC09_019190 [Saccharomycopsis crataegensis]
MAAASTDSINSPPTATDDENTSGTAVLSVFDIASKLESSLQDLLTKVESSDKELQDKVESLTKKLDRSEALRNQGDKSGSACSISS